MTPGEARELLGVDENTAPDALRRAYLRKIKEHKPERDPEGFRRCREAYELLQHFAPFRGRRPQTEVEPSAEVAAEHPPDRGDAPPYREPAPVVEPPPERVWFERLARLRSSAERIALLEEAIRELPESLDLVLELDAELAHVGRLRDGAEVLRQAAARGVRHAEEELFFAHAERLTPSELERLRASPIEGRAHVLCRAFAAQGQFGEVVQVATAAIAGEPSPARWLPVVLRLYEANEAARARRVLLAIQQVIEDRAEGARLPPSSRALLLLTVELSEVADRLGASVLAAVARALREGGDAPLVKVRAEHPREAENARSILEACTPALFAHVGPPLAIPRSSPRHPSTFQGVPFLVTLGVLSLLRLGSGMCSPHPRDPAVIVNRPTGGAEIETRSGRSHCNADRAACAALRRLSLALSDHRCEDASEAELSFAGAYARLGRSVPQLTRIHERLEDDYVTICLGTSPDAGPPDAPPGDAGTDAGRRRRRRE